MASLYLLYSLYITPTEGTFSQYMNLFDYSAEMVRRQVDTSNEGNVHPVVIGKNMICSLMVHQYMLLDTERYMAIILTPGLSIIRPKGSAPDPHTCTRQDPLYYIMRAMLRNKHQPIYN